MGRLKHIFIFLLLFSVASCYNENKPPIDKPEPLLSEKELVEVLTDIQLVEGILIYKRQKMTEPEEQYKDSVFQAVFDHYNITSQELRKNINYYNTNPKLMEKIYEEVLTNLSKKQSEINLEATKIDASRKAVMKAAENIMKEDEDLQEIKADSIL